MPQFWKLDFGRLLSLVGAVMQAYLTPLFTDIIYFIENLFDFPMENS